jgi:hypothetical protein
VEIVRFSVKAVQFYQFTWRNSQNIAFFSSLRFGMLSPSNDIRNLICAASVHFLPLSLITQVSLPKLKLSLALVLCSRDAASLCNVLIFLVRITVREHGYVQAYPNLEYTRFRKNFF